MTVARAAWLITVVIWVGFWITIPLPDLAGIAGTVICILVLLKRKPTRCILGIHDPHEDRAVVVNDAGQSIVCRSCGHVTFAQHL